MNLGTGHPRLPEVAVDERVQHVQRRMVGAVRESDFTVDESHKPRADLEARRVRCTDVQLMPHKFIFSHD